MPRPYVTMTPRSTTTVSQSEFAEILTRLTHTLEQMSMRLAVIESWVNEWEDAEMLVEEQIINHRDKTRDH